MNFKDLLALLGDLSTKHGLHTPYLVGGVPRDLMLKRNVEFNDFDITTGHADVAQLANYFAEAVGTKTHELRDGHRQVFTHGVKFDFSSNYAYPKIDSLLADQGGLLVGDRSVVVLI